MLIDSHCHINSLPKTLKNEVISGGSNYIFIDSGIDYQSCLSSIAVSQNCNFVYTSLGFHPFSIKSFSPDTISKFEQLIEKYPKIVAIGEVGLDHKAEIPLTEQERVLGLFVELAKKKNLTLVIHNRAKGDTHRVLDILNEHLSSYDKVVFHCFSYGRTFLDKILERKGIVSFSLNILREGKSVMSSLKNCPLENMFLETDSPYMRISGEPSTPLDIEKVYSFVSLIKGVERARLEEQVFTNVKEVFNI